MGKGNSFPLLGPPSPIDLPSTTISIIMAVAVAAKRLAEAGPERKHFKVLDAREKGNDKVQCVYCKFEMVGGATRMRAHLLKHRGLGCQPCTGDVPEPVREEMQRAEDHSKAHKLQKQKAAAVGLRVRGRDLEKARTQRSRVCARRIATDRPIGFL